MSSRRVIDLRPRGLGKAPPRGQQPLFGPRQEHEKERRPLPLRARRRRVRALLALIVLLFIGATVWGTSFVSYLPRFSINSIAVLGAHDISPHLISDYVETILNDGSYHFLSRTNIFLYPRAAIEKDIIGYFPRIRSAHVSRASLLSTEVKIEVEERKSFALWCADSGQCYQMDEGGFIFSPAPGAATSTQYVFEGGVGTSTSPIGQTFIRAHLPGLLTLLRFLGQAGLIPRGAIVENDQDFSVPLTAGFTLRASFGEDASALTKNLQLILSSDPLKGRENQLEYVDLRFGNRVYYKLFSGGESAFGGKGQTEATSTSR